MQRCIALIAAGLLALAGLACSGSLAASASSVQETYYVAPTGSDSNNGLSASTPFKTLDHARAVVATQLAGQSGEIDVDFASGDYPFSAPVAFGSADSPRSGYSVHYQAEAGQTPIFDGSTSVTGWTQSSGSIYSATLPGVNDLRDLWVNGRRASIARGPALTEYTGSGTNSGDVGTYTFSGTPSWALTPESSVRVPPLGIAFTSSTAPTTLAAQTNPSDLELVETVGFSQHVVGLQNLAVQSGFTEAVLQQPMGAIAWSEPAGWGSSFDDRTVGPRTWHLQNAYDFLTPGSFYFNSTTHVLYYDLRSGESMSSAVVRAPVTTQLITVAGTSTSARAMNIEFDGIAFGYTDWALLSVAGSHAASTVQGNALYDKYYADSAGQNNWHEAGDGYGDTELMPAAVQVSNASSISFRNDTFEHVGAGALNFGNDTNGSTVTGSVFSDMSGSAVTVGDPRNTYIGDGDFPSGVEGLPTGDVVSDDVITGAATEFQQTIPIMAYYTSGLTISHNVISGAPYTGISLGWGFNYYGGYSGKSGVAESTISGNNVISDNIVANVVTQLHDGGGIYVVGSQVGSSLIGNVVDAVGDSGEPIYTDQASSGWEIARNVVSDYGSNPWWYVWGSDAHVSDIDAHDNFGDYVTGSEGSNATSSTSVDNVSSWSALADTTVSGAGLEAPYAGNLPPGTFLGDIRGRIEGETGTLAGRAIISNDSAASGGALVAQLDSVGSSVTYGPVAAATSVTVHYASVNTGRISVLVNGVSAGSLAFASTGSWLSAFSDATATLNIPEGATVAFANETGDSGLNIDYLTFHRQQTGFLEAEAQTVSGRANDVYGIAGADDGGVVENLDVAGDAVSFANVGAASTISARYASDTSGHESVYVNGVRVGALPFSSTGGWFSGWTTTSLSTTIPAGATVTIECDSGDSGLNLDAITLS